MVFGCISKNFPENIFWCLEKKKENTNQKMQNNTNQKKKSHKSRKTQLQNNTGKLRLVHSNIFTENASNQAKETKTQQKKMNQRRATTGAMSDERQAVPSSIDKRACRTRTAHRSRHSSIDEQCDRLDDRTVRSYRSCLSIVTLVDRRAVRVRRARSLIAPRDLVDRAARQRGAIVGRAA